MDVKLAKSRQRIWGKYPGQWRKLFKPIFAAMANGGFNEVVLKRNGFEGKYILRRNDT